MKAVSLVREQCQEAERTCVLGGLVGAWRSLEELGGAGLSKEERCCCGIIRACTPRFGFVGDSDRVSKTTLDWAVFDWGMADCAVRIGDYSCELDWAHANLDWVDWE